MKRKYEYVWVLEHCLLTVYPNEKDRKKEYKIPSEEVARAVIEDLDNYTPYELRKVYKYCRISV